MKTITLVTPCYNEEGNITELYTRVQKVFEKLGPDYAYEHIFIDNCSKDHTVDELRALAAKDKRVKVIINNRNFGHIRSPYYGIIQARGDAMVFLVADLQDPPELIPEFVRHWENGVKVVKAVKTESSETPLMFLLRKAFYHFIGKISDIQLTKNFTGFGLYDQSVISELRKINDPYPYFRGLIAELGFPSVEVPFHQPTRKRGISANNFYTLFDMAMLGITCHSKVPLRLATMCGFALSLLCFLVGFLYMLAKLIFWQYFTLGTAPVVVGIFFLGSIQLFFLGILGEYIGSIYTQVLNRPLVTVKERINFDDAN